MSKVQIYLLGEDDKAKSQLQHFLAGESISELDTEFPTAIIPKQHTFISKIGEVFSATVHFTPGEKRFTPLLKHYINKADIICYVYDFEDKTALGRLTHLLEAQQLHLSYAPLAKETIPVIIGINGQPSRTNDTVELVPGLTAPVFLIDFETTLHKNPGYQALFNYIVQFKSPKGIHDDMVDLYHNEPYKKFILRELSTLIKAYKKTSAKLKSCFFLTDKQRKEKIKILTRLHDRISHSPDPYTNYQGVHELLSEANPKLKNLLTPLIMRLEQRSLSLEEKTLKEIEHNTPTVSH